MSKVNDNDGTRVISQRILLPKDFDRFGVMDIGLLLEDLDICTCISAERFCKKSCVTLSMDDLLFEDVSIRPGDVLIIQSQVNRAFNTSIECGVIVDVERVTKNETIVSNRFCSSYFVFVALDDNGKPSKVPVMHPGPTLIEQLRFTLAADRRDIRLNRTKIEAASSMKSSHMSLKAPRFVDPSLNAMTKMVLPPNANHNGSTFGGALLNWSAQIAHLVSTRHTGGVPVEIIGVDDVYFLAPSKVGHRVNFHSRVNRVFPTYFEVGVRVESQKLDGTTTLVMRCYILMTLYVPDVDDDVIYRPRWQKGARPKILHRIPQVLIESEADRLRFDKALGRRNVRRERLVLRGRTMNDNTQLSTPSFAWPFPENFQTGKGQNELRSMILENLVRLSRFVDPSYMSSFTWFPVRPTLVPKPSSSSSSSSSSDAIKIRAALFSQPVNGTLIYSTYDLLHHPMAKIFAALLKIESCKAWDPYIQSMEQKQIIDSNNDLVLLVAKNYPLCNNNNNSSSSSNSNGQGLMRSFLLRSWRESPNQCVLAKHSMKFVQDKPSPIPENHYLIASGFIVQQIEINTCRIIHVSTISAHLITSELERYANMEYDRFVELEKYLAFSLANEQQPQKTTSKL